MDDDDIIALVDEVVDRIEDRVDFEDYADRAGIDIPVLIDRVANELKARNQD